MELIYAYSRKQAIEDGVLLDVSDTAKEAGFKLPVALTSAVWSNCVDVPVDVDGQDEQGRLWDILWMLHFAIKRAKQNGTQSCVQSFQLYVRNDNEIAEPPLVTLKAVCGPGDDAEPVITIMLPHED